jgi:hypothetical protein
LAPGTLLINRVKYDTGKKSFTFFDGGAGCEKSCEKIHSTTYLPTYISKLAKEVFEIATEKESL